MANTTVKVTVGKWMDWIENIACDLKGTLVTTKEGFIHGANHFGYVLGAKGQVYTETLAQLWGRTKSKGWAYFVKECAKWIGRRVLDCSGLLTVGVAEVLAQVFKAQCADYIYSHCPVKGNMASRPEIKGICVHKKGHIGVYDGGGWVIESRGHDYGVVKSRIESQPWTGWGKPEFIDFADAVPVANPAVPAKEFPDWYTPAVGKYIHPEDKGDIVTKLQQELQKRGFFLRSGKCTGFYGSVTKAAVKKAQAAMGLKGKDADGIFGDQTAREWQIHYPI